jgi:hypothetical protein
VPVPPLRLGEKGSEAASLGRAIAPRSPGFMRSLKVVRLSAKREAREAGYETVQPRYSKARDVSSTNDVASSSEWKVYGPGRMGSTRRLLTG